MTERNTHHRDIILVSFEQADNTVIEAGNIVALSAGYAQHATDATGLIVVGVANETMDNTGGNAGDVAVHVRRKKSFYLKNSGTNPITQADVGGNAYVEDSQTVASSTTNNIATGKVLGLDGAGVWVEIE
ncbi:MAG: hypothetical protein GY696_28580 [Gammaproteobacteria bacterium]|nr:hypothetical protein [Gammaproteobacteria bacterium]